MKRQHMVSLLLALFIITAIFSGCGKSQPIKDAEAAINSIGTVSIESGELIEKAEKLYNILTDSEKSKVENRLALVDAREEYNKLKQNEVYDNAKKAYEKLNDVAELCEKGMDDIYGAWYFGIYKADDSSSSNVLSNMAKETPNLSKSDLEAGAEFYGTLTGGWSSSDIAWMMTSDWQYCLYVVESAIAVKGDYDTITAEMEEAQKILQELTTTYDDYTYYPKLKDYYASVSSYVDFFSSPTGSFSQLSDTINTYENSIRTYKSDVGFLFNK